MPIKLLNKLYVYLERVSSEFRFVTYDVIVFNKHHEILDVDEAMAVVGSVDAAAAITDTKLNSSPSATRSR